MRSPRPPLAPAPAPVASTWAILAAIAIGASTSFAQSDPWPFSFDTALAADPVGVNQRIDELAEDVPPIPSGDLVSTNVGPVTLYFHDEMLELLERAFDSGPGFQSHFDRVPTMCAQHEGFAFPSTLLTQNSAVCLSAEQSLRNLTDDVQEACLRIEFPELYVADQTPNEASVDDLQTLEGLIRIAGEVFRHMDHPAGLLPDAFEDDARIIIAKIRYGTLRENAVARRAAYVQAKTLLDDQASCFNPQLATALAETVLSMVDELDVATDGLDAIYAAGLAQASDDFQALADQGRTRNPLPHPSLTDDERERIALYIGGLYWRMRGEALLTYPESGLLRRLLYTQYPYQVIADLTGGVDATDIGRDIFIHETWGYFEWMDIGRNPGNDKYSDMVDMAKRGKRTLDLAAPHLAERGYDNAFLYAGGLQMGPCYYYAWEPLWEPNRYFQYGEDLTDPYVWFLESPTAHGEFCTGGALGVGLARSFLHGKEASGCVSNCVNKVCGVDGCGGSCGTCAFGSACDDGVCNASDSDAGSTPVDVDAGAQEPNPPDAGVIENDAGSTAPPLTDAGPATSRPDAGAAFIDAGGTNEAPTGSPTSDGGGVVSDDGDDDDEVDGCRHVDLGDDGAPWATAALMVIGVAACRRRRRPPTRGPLLSPRPHPQTTTVRARC